MRTCTPKAISDRRWGTKRGSGVVLADQVKSLDWRIRRAEVVGRLPETVVMAVLGKLQTLLAR